MNRRQFKYFIMMIGSGHNKKLKMCAKKTNKHKSQIIFDPKTAAAKHQQQYQSNEYNFFF